MLRLSPPYREEQLNNFALSIISQRPLEGYPDLSRRLTINAIARRALRPGARIIKLPSGYDATKNPNRDSATSTAKLNMDPDIITGSDEMLSKERMAEFAALGYTLDQHGRPLHPGYSQLLSLLGPNGALLGMPTGIGQFYRYGRNGVAKGVVFRKSSRPQDEEILLTHCPQRGWLLPGGNEQQIDKKACLDPSILCATRKVFELTNLEVSGTVKVISCLLPVGPADTLNAWLEIRGVAFLDCDENYLHDVPPEANSPAIDAQWLPISQILRGEIKIPVPHERHVAEAYEERLKMQNS